MIFSLEVLDAFSVFSKDKIENLQEKELVCDMIVRRRLTRNAKIFIYLANKISLKNERVIYASNYGELKESISILENILACKSPSPTDFQNSVYNTPSAYFSIIFQNTSEILTVSNGDKTSQNALKVAAIKSMDGDEIVICTCESFSFDAIQDLGKCCTIRESGAILKVKYSNKKPNILLNDIKKESMFAPSISELITLSNFYKENGKFILGIEC